MCLLYSRRLPGLLKLKRTISFSRGRTLSGHTWSIAKKFLILNLSSLHPYGESYLVYAARRWYMLLGNCSQLLGNSSWWSDHEFDCSALIALARTSSRQRCTMGTRCLGTSCGGYDPGYPRQTTWAAPPGAAQPIRRSLVGHDAARRLSQDTGKIS